MIDRTRNTWNVTLQADNGEVIESEFSAYWDPEKVSTEQIAVAAAAQAFGESKQQRRFAPIAASLVTA